MSYLRYFAIATVGLLLVGGIYCSVFHKSVPSYGGRNWQDWYQTWYTNRSGTQARLDAEVVLHQIGRENLSYFVSVLREPRTFRHASVRRVLYNLPYLGAKLEKNDTREVMAPADAQKIFEILGPEASPAIDGLVDILESETNGGTLGRAAYILGKIGKPAVPAFRKLLTSERPISRLYVIDPVCMETGSNNTFEELMPYVMQATTNSDPAFAAAALRGLGMSFQGDKVLPAIINGVNSTNASVACAALGALCFYGPRASNALPFVEKNLSAPEPMVRKEATNAWKRLHPNRPLNGMFQT